MITIFTSIYNRANIIDNLYQSLCRQTNFDFEWLIINDGSTDNIKDVISKYKKVNTRFPIRFYSQENGGKHRAINRALDLANGEYFFIVDSDDFLTNDAVEKVLIWFKQIDPKEKYIGVSGQRAFLNGDIIGTFPKSRRYVDVSQASRKKAGIYGDKAEIYITSILKKKRFPEFTNENFIPEGALLYQFSIEGYKVRYYQDVIYYGDYLKDALTRNPKIFVENFRGILFFERVNMKALPFPYNKLAYMRYIDICKLHHIPVNQILEDIHIGKFQYDIYILLLKVKHIIKYLMSIKEGN